MNFIEQIAWRPEIGDPSVLGWVTVAAYGVAAVAAWLAARRARPAPGLASGSRGFWLLIAALMGLLCLNKQLDLQSLLTGIGRVIAWQHGWYQERREFQRWFVLATMAASLLASLCIAVRFRVFWQHHVLLGCGLAFLLTFIVVRAISFHHVDSLLKVRIAGARVNWLLELAGILMIGLAAWRDFRNPRPGPPGA